MQFQSLAICCPNCGGAGRRTYILRSRRSVKPTPTQVVTQTECPQCDYFLVIGTLNGQVVEAHAPGLSGLHPSLN